MRAHSGGRSWLQTSLASKCRKCRKRRGCSNLTNSTVKMKSLVIKVFNLYHAAYWIISPATAEARGGKGCSYVELIATKVAEQRPHFFVSHAWVEAVSSFFACLLKHAQLRLLTSSTAYWVCAYANNQHALHEEISTNPRKTSFYKAMSLCVGVLLILDHHATPFQRIWCCFEESIVVRP